MQVSITYQKDKVLKALRYHFIWQPEIRILFILIVVFDVISAVLYIMGKIRPEPFLLGSLIWFLFIISFWFLLPSSIYRKAATFKDKFTMYFTEGYMKLENERGYTEWQWQQCQKYFETPDFFHIYFSAKSFFLIPKDNMDDDFRFSLRDLLKRKISSFKN